MVETILRDYWKDFRNIKNEIKNIERVLSHFPDSKEIEKINRRLARAIFEYHGGMYVLRERMEYKGYEKKPAGYWKDINNIKEKIRKFIEEIGYFPTTTELIKKSEFGLLSAIADYCGGINKLRQLMGYPIENIRKKRNPTFTNKNRKPIGYFKNFENIVKELKFIEGSLGHFPSFNEVREIDNSLATSMYFYHNSFNDVKKKMGITLTRKSCYWPDFQNVERELEPLIKKLGKFPTRSEFYQERKEGLYDAIFRYHDGISKVREKLGYDPLIERSRRGIKHRYRQRKIKKEVIKNNLTRKPRYYWKSTQNIRNKLEPLLQELGHFPTKKELLERSGNSIIHGIKKYHGGLINLRKKFGFEYKLLTKKCNGYYKNIENVKKELEPVIMTIGHFPTEKELNQIGKSGLAFGIRKYHHGTHRIREFLRYSGQSRRKPHGFYRDIRNLKGELGFIIKELEHFPSYSELRVMKKSSLATAISKYYGGINKIREIMGHPPTNNHKIRTEKSLVELLDNDEKARRVVEIFGGDRGDVLDILAVVYEGRLSQEDAARLVAKPSVRAYLGRFRRPIGGIGELAEISNEILPHDKNDVIKGILYRKVTEYIYQKCGPYPSKERREGLLNEFELELGKVGGNGGG